MSKRIILIVFLFSYFFHLDVFSLSLLPFDQEQEKQKYIFRTLTSIERQSVWIEGNFEDALQDEIEQSIDLAFNERRLDPAEWYFDWNETPASATLRTQITFYGKLVMIDVGLLSEALLLKSQVLIPAIIWKKRVVLNLEGNELQTNEEIAKHTKILIGNFLDEYMTAKA